MKRLPSPRVLVLTFLVFPAWGPRAPAAGARGTYRLGRFRIAADSPLARNEHPRLLFTSGDLPRLRRRARLPRVREDLELIDRLARREKGKR